MLCPVSCESEKQVAFTRKISHLLKTHQFHVDMDLSENTINKKIKKAASEYNHVIIIGDKEIENDSLSVRSRGSNNVTEIPVEDFVLQLKNDLLV